MKSALITGVTGQDGSYLAELLLGKGYEVVGLRRRTSVENTGRLRLCLGHPQFELIEGDMVDAGSVYRIVSSYRPTEVYNLAAQSDVGASFGQPELTFQVNTLGTLHLLEAIRQCGLVTRFYQASTSEMFGKARGYQEEDTRIAPQSPYAISKASAHHLVRMYRDAYGVYACRGILFNHESERRGAAFVTRKITMWLAQFSNWADRNGVCCSDVGFAEDDIYIRDNKGCVIRFPKLRLGNLDARRDWGHARDYVEAMYLMMQQREPRDYVIATGESRSIRDFLVASFSLINVSDWTGYVVSDPKFYRPSDVGQLRGCAEKAKKELRWVPKVGFEELVRLMVEHDRELVRRSG